MPRFTLGLFLVSAATLALEVLQTKIFAYTLDSVTIYMVVGIALLGFGASGTMLALVPAAVGGKRPADGAAAVTILGALLTLFAHVVLAHGSIALSRMEGSQWLLVLLALFLPYFALGWTTAWVLRAGADRVDRLYGVNMLGSGAGCLLVFPLLPAVGAQGLLLLLIALLGMSALCFEPASRFLRAMSFLVATSSCALVPFGEAIMPFLPEPMGQTAFINDALRQKGLPPMARIYARWDPTGQIEVHQVVGQRSWLGQDVDVHFFGHDGSAGSILIGTEQDSDRAKVFFEESPYGVAYQARGVVRGRPCRSDGPDVLVIGLGGHPDIQCALHWGARSVTGVEINASTIELARSVFRSFLGDPYQHDCVKVENTDGRTFLRRTTDRYDVIQLSGVDTKQVLAAGSLAVSENYLYTIEATRDLMDHLKPGGVLNVVRFGPGDIARQVATMAVVLRERGIRNPEQHLCVFMQGLWTMLLVRNEPWTLADEKRFLDWGLAANARKERMRIPPYDLILCGLDKPLESVFVPSAIATTKNPLFLALPRGDEHVWLAQAEDDFSPVPDDRPFFFNLARFSDLFRDPVPVRALPHLRFFKVAGGVALFALLFILLPVLVRPRVGGFTAAAVPYFAALGIGFVFVEVGLMQKFVLFLGHSTYSITVVLCGLLICSGLGAALGSRLVADPVRRVRAAAVAILVVSLLYALGLDAVFLKLQALPLAGRIGIALLAIVPLGVPMGMPFPSGLSLIATRGDGGLPWALGINGFASVIGSVLILPATIFLGLRVSVLIGAGLYLLPLVLVPRLPRAT